MLIFFVLQFCTPTVLAAGPSVFVNEIHYDDTDTDSGEAIEIAGPAGTPLASWSLVLYNGSNREVYSTTGLSGSIPDLGGGFGVVSVSYPVNGIQNGPSDGIALVAPGPTVIQFLSYEGTFVASNGPAAGMLSTDIGISESSSTAEGQSLQLSGPGTTYDEFSWVAQAETFDAFNTGQTFVPGTAVLVINEVDYEQLDADTAEFIELKNTGSAEADLSDYYLQLIDGSGGGATSYQTIDLPATPLAPGEYFVVCGNAAMVANCDLETTPDANLIEDGAPDAIALFDDTNALVDTVSYEGNSGAPYTETSGVGLEDTGDGSLSRCADGRDTGHNSSDFAFSPNITPGAVNNCAPPPVDCGNPATLIHAIQGGGSASPLAGSDVAIEGIVVGDFQDGNDGSDGDLDGFYVQEEDADADASPATSEGIFIYDGPSPSVNVQVGDHVRVSGTVTEDFDLTELGFITSIQICATGEVLPTPTEVSLPLTATSDLESFEAMLVTFPRMVIGEFFNFDRLGEIALVTDRQFQPTAVFEPGSQQASDLASLNALSRITLDDGRTVQNPDPAIHPDGTEFDLDNLFRGGDILEDVTGVMDYRFDAYRVQPTEGATHIETNPRTEQPDEVGGSLRVASFNVLNYFNGDGSGGGFPTSRGADTLAEFNRQRDKIISAIVAMDAEIVGLIEIENDGYGSASAIQDLVNGLNDATAPANYDFVDPGVVTIGSDEIAVGLIYRPAIVSLRGGSAIIDSSVDPDFIDTKNRPALAQSFEEVSSGEVLTVVVNHLKSKGSDCDELGDPDTGDGSGNCNLTRAKAAQALADWLATDPTGSGDPDVLVLGDLNAYDKEDPIDALTGSGYTDLSHYFAGEFAYSYVFNGQLGYLDYALSNASLLNQVSGIDQWNINSDEPDLINYDTTFKQPAQQAIYAPDAFRSSDHDPIVVGLNLGGEANPETVFENGFENGDTD